jgi:hypothetical protein
MPTSAAATSQDWSMTSQIKTASIMPTLNATEPFQVRVTLNQFRAELVEHGDNDRAATDGDEIIARATHDGRRASSDV